MSSFKMSLSFIFLILFVCPFQMEFYTVYTSALSLKYWCGFVFFLWTLCVVLKIHSSAHLQWLARHACAAHLKSTTVGNRNVMNSADCLECFAIFSNCILSRGSMRKIDASVRGSRSCTADLGGISVFMESMSLTSLLWAADQIEIVAFLFVEENNTTLSEIWFNIHLQKTWPYTMHHLSVDKFFPIFCTFLYIRCEKGSDWITQGSHTKCRIHFKTGF